MSNTLPIIQYNKIKYYVDFRLQELRNVKTAQRLRFVDIPEHKHSRVKKRLRLIRFKIWRQEYIRGVDD